MDQEEFKTELPIYLNNSGNTLSELDNTDGFSRNLLPVVREGRKDETTEKGTIDIYRYSFNFLTKDWTSLPDGDYFCFWDHLIAKECAAFLNYSAYIFTLRRGKTYVKIEGQEDLIDDQHYLTHFNIFLTRPVWDDRFIQVVRICGDQTIHGKYVNIEKDEGGAVIMGKQDIDEPDAFEIVFVHHSRPNGDGIVPRLFSHENFKDITLNAFYSLSALDESDLISNRPIWFRSKWLSF